MRSSSTIIKHGLILVFVFLIFTLGNSIVVQGDEATIGAASDGEQIQTMSTGEIPKDYVRNKIESHDVMVFARSYGPHNRKAKELLKRLSNTINVNVEFLDVDLLPGWDGSLIMTELQAMTGQWSFPNIFIGKDHVGGNKELDQRHALGELEDMIRNSGQEL